MANNGVFYFAREKRDPKGHKIWRGEKKDQQGNMYANQQLSLPSLFLGLGAEMCVRPYKV